MGRRKDMTDELWARVEANGCKRGAHTEVDGVRDAEKYLTKTKDDHDRTLQRYLQWYLETMRRDYGRKGLPPPDEDTACSQYLGPIRSHGTTSGLDHFGSGKNGAGNAPSGIQPTSLDQGTTSQPHPHQEVTDERKLMDPASSGTGSNVLAGASATGTGHGTRSDGPNKFYKGDEPHHHEVGAFSSPSTGTGGAVGQGQHLRDNVADSNNTSGVQHTIESGYPADYSSSQQHQQGPTRDNYALQHHTSDKTRSTAAANGATGVGWLAASRIPDRLHRPDETSGQPALRDQAYGAIDGTGRHNHASRDNNDGSRGGIYNTVT